MISVNSKSKENLAPDTVSYYLMIKLSLANVTALCYLISKHFEILKPSDFARITKAPLVDLTMWYQFHHNSKEFSYFLTFRPLKKHIFNLYLGFCDKQLLKLDMLKLYVYSPFLRKRSIFLRLFWLKRQTKVSYSPPKHTCTAV